MNIVNKKLIVVALATVPLTAFGLSALSDEVPIDFTMSAAFESGVSLNIDKANTFEHPDIDIRLSSNTSDAATLTLGMTNAGYLLSSGDTSVDGQLLKLKVACVTENVFGVNDGTADVSATGDYTFYSATEVASTQDVLVGSNNPVVVDDDVNGSTNPNYVCAFTLADNESLDELYSGNYSATITLSWTDNTNTDNAT